VEISNLFIQILVAICTLGCVATIGLLAWSGMRSQLEVEERMQREVAIREEMERELHRDRLLEVEVEKLFHR